MYNDSSEEQSFNLLAVMLFLLNDYYENGSYSNTEDTIESNGSGEILWDKTINETFTIISNNRPYYTDLQTRKRISDEHDYFKRLHESVLTTLSNELKEAGLLDIFEITGVELSDEETDNFGDKDYILYRIEKELNVQFNTRKQLVLKTLYAYIDRSGKLADIDCLSMFGTNSFNLVWEDVCKVILDNQLDTPIWRLKLPVQLSDKYAKERGKKLIELIEKPLWSVTKKEANDTLIPDSISISDSIFLITDAKYYVPKLVEGQTPKAMPGIESVTKQYLYQLAYKDFIKVHGLNACNCFIMPTEAAEVTDMGMVSMKMLTSLELEPIKVRYIPAAEAYKHYLSETKIGMEELRL